MAKDDDILKQDDGSVVVNFEEKEPEKKDDDLEVVEKKEPEKAASPEKKDEEDPIEVLKRQVAEGQKTAEAERLARIAAERKVTEAENKTLEFQSKAQEHRYNSIVSAIGTAQSKLQTAKANLAKNLADGDYIAVGDAQAEIARYATSLVQLEAGKEQLEQALEAVKNEPRRETPADPVEAFAATRTQRTAAWIRSHPEVVTDPVKNLKVTAADATARANGLIPDTDEYFDFVEKELGYKSKDIEKTEEAPKGGRNPSRPVDAPVSRSAPNGQNQHSKTLSVTLSKAEVEIAENMGMTPKEYAQNKLALINEGQLQR